MTTKELKEKYLKFFEEKGHKVIPGASLIPENDSTVLFTTAGMHPLIPYLLGEKHPMGRRLTNVQKCIRTSDIEEVGDDVHLTFFEMLGNWSLGDSSTDSTNSLQASSGQGYWKKEAIEWSFEFLFSKKWLGLDKNKLSVSCFNGEPGIPKDEESAEVWQKLGVPKEKIKFLKKEDNFWGPVGEVGPCGPCTEIFYEGVEIWNDVFMEYNKECKTQPACRQGRPAYRQGRNAKRKTYEYVPLKQKNVDTGMGVERTIAILNGKKSVFDIEPLKSIVKKVHELAHEQDIRAERIIADHLRAATFILGDEKGIQPSNLGQGYVLRRLIRRAIRYGKKIGINKSFTFKIAEVVIEKMSNEYPELKKNKDFIIEQLIQEEEKFSKTLEKGLRIFDKKIQAYEVDKKTGEIKGEIPKLSLADETLPFVPTEITGKWLFDIYQTFGFPLEMSIEELKNREYYFSDVKLKRLKKEFQEEFQKHQEISRTATAGKFKGGLIDNSKEVTKLHTATHLLLAALRQVLGEHVYQKGSNITAERLRLDFSHSEKMTPKQIKKVENLVNEQIKKNLPVSCEQMSLSKAKKIGAMGVFESKYGEKVKVYSIGDSKKPFSREICNGPHVKSTAPLGLFKIKKEESSSAGVRRIKAVLE